MSEYEDDFGNQRRLPSATVWEETKTSRVIYRNEAGNVFRVLVREKPNPIGFTARQPGATIKRR